MNPAQWRKSLQKEVPGAVLIAGADSGLRRRSLDYLREALGADRDEEHFTGEFDRAELADALQTLPFFGSARLCILECDRLTGETADFVVAQAESARPPNHLAVLLPRLDKRGKLYKALSKRTVDCAPLKEPQLRRAAAIFLKERGVSAEAEAVEHLLLAAGGNVEALENRIESLSLLVEPGGTIDGETARRALSATPGFNPFTFCDLLTGDRPVEAVAATQRALEAGEEPLRLIGLIARHYRIAQLVRHLGLRRSSDAEIARAVGVYASYLSGYKAAARRLSHHDLLCAQRCLLSYDAAFKLGLPAPRTAFLELVYALARRGEAGWPNFLADLPERLEMSPSADPAPVLRPTG
jgi:DNA polymerase III subunit delta